MGEKLSGAGPAGALLAFVANENGVPVPSGVGRVRLRLACVLIWGDHDARAPEASGVAQPAQGARGGQDRAVSDSVRWDWGLVPSGV